MNQCSICLDEFNDNSIRCKNPKCNQLICLEYLESLLEYSIKNNTVPICICKNIIVDGIPTKYYKSFTELVYLFLKSSEQESIMSISFQLQLYKSLRQEKLEFIKKNFPIAISKTIEISFHKKLKMVEKKNTDELSIVKCYKMYCKGLLKNGSCLVCTTQVCSKCDEIKETEHMCSKDALETKKLIDSIVKCPKCFVPVEKINGCNNITCPYCKTNFCYRTGKRTNAGNHSAQTLVDQKTRSLYTTFIDVYNTHILTLLKKFEDDVPKIYDYHKLVKSISENKSPAYISNYYCKYKMGQYNSMRHYMTLDKINNLHARGLLDYTSLKSLVDKSLDKKYTVDDENKVIKLKTTALK